jgi:hypothetical protein
VHLHPQQCLRVGQSVYNRHLMRLHQSLTPQRACCWRPRAQRGRVSERLAEVCGLSLSPRQDRRVSRPAACVRPAGRTASLPATSSPRNLHTAGASAPSWPPEQNLRQSCHAPRGALRCMYMLRNLQGNLNAYF